jgi:beta-xylosidase
MIVSRISYALLLAFFLYGCSPKLNTPTNQKQTAGNPVFPGWYADPEGAVFNKQFWIYPTYSAPYNEQVFLDAFSSRDLVNWEKHSRITDTSTIKWVKRALWAPAVVQKGKVFFIFWRQ